MFQPFSVFRGWLGPMLGSRDGEGTCKVVKKRIALWRALAGAVLGVVVACGAVAYLHQQRDAALRDAEREVRNLSFILAASLESAFRAVELMEVGALDWMRAEEIDRPDTYAERTSSRAVYDALLARMVALPQVKSVFMTDADGRVTVGTKAGWPVPEILHAGRDFFQAFLDDPGRETFLSSPSRNSIDGVWNVYVARRVRSPDGRFLGIFGATITLDYFEQFFASVALGPDSAIALVRRDGLLLARYPRLDAAIGNSMAGGAAFQRVLPVAREGIVTEQSPVDGRERIKGIRALEGYPLVIIATRATDEVLDSWRREARRVGAVVLLLEAMVFASVLLVNRQARHREAVEQLRAGRADAEARLALAEERERAGRALAERDAALSAIFDTGAAGLSEVDIATGRFIRVNRRYCEITGWTEAELLGGIGPPDVVHPEDRALVREGWHASIVSGGNWDAELRYLRPDGTTRWGRVSISTSAYDGQGRPLRCVGIVQDTTASREAEALLRMSLAVGRIGSFRHDYPAGVVHANPEARAMYGLPLGEEPIQSSDWFSSIHPEDRARLLAYIQRAQAERAPDGAVSYRVQQPASGRVSHIEARVRYEYDAAGRMLSALGMLIDVTENREAEARIAYLAHHDALTGLPNRVLFRERLDEALDRAGRGEGFALLCLDLDRFKEVNDTLGHPVGDALLREVAERVRAELRETDTLARLGGDEFAVIQAAVQEPGEATTLARRMVEALGMAFELDGHQVTVGTSIGITLVPSDGLDADILLKNADMALYRAKAEGRGRWRFFEPEMDAHMQLRRALELDLRRALNAGEFELFYQPIVDIPSRRVSGLEALLRWRHPERGLVPPDRFIPLAEEIGLIIPLGEWILAEACAEATSWPGAPKVAVNLSPVQFASGRLVEAVATALDTSGLDPARLELEITETVMLQDTEATLATLHRLKALGVRIALDDFGTGYSSLSYLQRFPFDKVKIDRCFTRWLDESKQTNAIVRSIVDLCRALGMTTTAEGVETEVQLAALQRKGCQEAQGYLFSRPKPAAEVAGLLLQFEDAAG